MQRKLRRPCASPTPHMETVALVGLRTSAHKGLPFPTQTEFFVHERWTRGVLLCELCDDGSGAP
jgi:hypothetical protein